MKEPVIVRDQSLLMRDDGILHVVHLSAREHTTEDALASMKQQLILQNGKKTPVLVDLRKAQKISHQAHADYARIKHVTAVGLLTESELSQHLANRVIHVFKPEFPIKLFYDEASAIEWLKQFLDQP